MSIKRFITTEFQHHHAFFLIILIIGVFFSGNVLAYSVLENNVQVQRVYTQPLKENTSSDKEQNPLEDVANHMDEYLPIIEQFSNNNPVTIGVWLQDLSDDSQIGLNESVTFESASLYKLFVAFEAYKRIDLGIHSPTDNIPTSDGDQTIEHCLEVSITVSDNPCGRALRELVNANIEPLPSLAEVGFVGTSLVNDYPTTSASDVALLFEKLYRESDLSKESNDQFISHLLNQEVNNRIPAGLPANSQAAHKTGDLSGYSHDGGIIYTDKGNYILVIMSGPWDNGYDDAPPEIADFVSSLYSSLPDNTLE